MLLFILANDEHFNLDAHQFLLTTKYHRFFFARVCVCARLFFILNITVAHVCSFGGGLEKLK